MAGGNTEQKMHVRGEECTADLKMISTLPGERSGGGAHLPQGTLRLGHSPLARPVSVLEHPSPGSDAFVTCGSSGYSSAAAGASGSH